MVPSPVSAQGVCATVVGDAVFTPLDTVKQRLQLANSPYSSLTDCVRRTLRDEGWRAFYRSYKTTLIMNVPFTAVQFAVYESGKKARATAPRSRASARIMLTRGAATKCQVLVAAKVLSSADEEGLVEQLVAGGAAGGLAAALTNPLDIAKTRLQTAGVWEPVAEGGGARRGGGGAGRVMPLLREIVVRAAPHRPPSLPLSEC